MVVLAVLLNDRLVLLDLDWLGLFLGVAAFFAPLAGDLERPLFGVWEVRRETSSAFFPVVGRPLLSHSACVGWERAG